MNATPANPPPRLRWRQFALHIVSPAVVTFALFLLLLFAFVVPTMERQIIDRKKETIRKLTQAAWSELAAMHEREKSGALDRGAAQQAAISRISDLRYGDEGKDYFWVSDMHPRMVMHPYRPELNGQDLSDYLDRAGRRMFVEFAQVVREQGGGYVEYFWQWQDDQSQVVPKLSYVKGFEPWGWIVGTGIYLEDVRVEVGLMVRRVIFVSLGISGIVAGLLFHLARQGLGLERRRWRTETALRESEEKYRLLVEGTRVGIMLALGDRLVFANRTALGLLGRTEAELGELPLGNVVDPVPSAPVDAAAHGAEQPAVLVRKDGERLDMLLAVAPVQIGGQPGLILSFKDRTAHKRTEEMMASLLDELQTTQALPTRPVGESTLTEVSCAMDTPVAKAAALMARAGSSAILVRAPSGEAVGIVTDADLRNRVLAVERAGSGAVSAIMSAPLVHIADHALLYEAVREMQERGIQHLVVTDGSGKTRGLLPAGELLRAQRHPVAALSGRIAKADSEDELRQCREQVPLFVKSMLESGTRVERVTRMMAAVSDAIVVRLVERAVEKFGPPPAGFSFVVLGSEARGEQTLATDQDNAIIFEDVEPERQETVQAYFLGLGAQVCGRLDEVGYRRCQGGVMAANPKWCRSLSHWRAHLSRCVETPDPQELLDVNALLDFRHAFGDPGLVAALRVHLRELLKAGQPAFFFHLATATLQFKPPLGFFGNIQLEQRTEHHAAFNIKGAIIPIVNFARVYALRHHIAEVGTLERLGRLLELHVLVPSSHGELVQAYSALMKMRLEHQVARIAGGAEPDNLIDLGELTRLERAMLKKVFADLSVFQTRLRQDFVRAE